MNFHVSFFFVDRQLAQGKYGSAVVPGSPPCDRGELEHLKKTLLSQLDENASDIVIIAWNVMEEPT